VGGRRHGCKWAFLIRWLAGILDSGSPGCSTVIVMRRCRARVLDMGLVRITRLLVNGFRGWHHLDLRPRGHVLLAGVPRAGRSDIIAALVRVLDPNAKGPRMSDLHQSITGPAPTASGGPAAVPPDASPAPATAGLVRVEHADIEVTLTDLDPDAEQAFDGFLEPLDPSGAASDDPDADPSLPQCVRIACRLAYDSVTEELTSTIYFPLASDPAMGRFVKVPLAARRTLPVVVLDAARPLQLRAGGNLRKIVNGADPTGADAAFAALGDAVSDAAGRLSAEPAIASSVDAVLGIGGTGVRVGDSPVTAVDVGFLAEDGTVGALLRALQPALHLDRGGLLPLSSHGSTTAAVLSAAEAMLLASVPGAVVLADDFGDQLDTAAAEHLAAMLRAQSGQLWLSTRRPEAARAFDPAELVRLTRPGGTRTHHQLERITDRKALSAMRQLHTQLLAALTSPTVAITEGPHDLAAYSFVDRRKPPTGLPLSAHGVRLVAAGTGQDGGIDQIPRVAALARQLGFRVLAVIDQDKGDAEKIKKVQAECDVVIRLPKGAVERAIVAGIPGVTVVTAAKAVLDEFGVPDPFAGACDEAAITRLCKVIHKHGLHEQLLEALYREFGTHPPMIDSVLDCIVRTSSATYTGPTLIDLVEIPRPGPGAP